HCERRAAWLERPHPCRSVQLVVHVIVGETRAAHERRSANHVTLRHQAGDDLFATQTVLRRQDRAAPKQMRHRSECLARLARLRGDDAEVKLRQLCWLACGLQFCVKLIVAGYANPTLVDAARVFFPANQRPHLCNARQMRGVQAADCARSDDEDAFQRWSSHHRGIEKIKNQKNNRGFSRINADSSFKKENILEIAAACRFGDYLFLPLRLENPCSSVKIRGFFDFRCASVVNSSARSSHSAPTRRAASSGSAQTAYWHCYANRR